MSAASTARRWGPGGEVALGKSLKYSTNLLQLGPKRSQLAKSLALTAQTHSSRIALACWHKKICQNLGGGGVLLKYHMVLPECNTGGCVVPPKCVPVQC